MKRLAFEPGEFQKCVHWQDILFVLRVWETLYGVEDYEPMEYRNHGQQN